MVGQPIRLVDRLRQCLANPSDPQAWTEFLFHLDGIIGPPITKYVERWMAVHRRNAPGISLLEEIEDLKQLVWFRLVRSHGDALLQFKGDSDPSLRAYLTKIAITVTQDYLKHLGVEVRSRAQHFQPYRYSGGLRPGSRVCWNDFQREGMIWVREMEDFVCTHSAINTRDRDRRILQLWLEGCSPSEIKQHLGLAISKQAVRKIVGKQKNLMRLRWGQ